MNENIKYLIIGLLFGVLITAVVSIVVVKSLQEPLGGSTSATFTAANLVSNGTITSAGTFTASAASTFTGTTTVAQSVDGLVVGGTISTAATGTVVTVYTNSTGPKFCDADTSFLYVKNNGSFAPSLVFSLGTSTSAVASTNLVASSTVATTTTTLLVPSGHQFILAQGDVLTAIFGDITNTTASSTYFSNWSAEAGVWCQDISI